MLACICVSLSSHAACVNPNNPVASPVAGVEMFFDIHGSPGRWPESIAKSTYGLGNWGRSILGSGSYALSWLDDWTPDFKPGDDLEGIGYIEGQGAGTISLESDGRPPAVWPNHIDPVKTDKKKIGPAGGAIYFYEPDGKGGRRVCRMERWLSRHIMFMPGEDEKTEPRKVKVNAASSSNQTRNPALAALSKDYFLAGYSNLIYDKQGRLPHIGPVCFYYTADGQVDWVAYESPKGQCSGKKPDTTKESLIEVLFDAKGKGYGSVLTMPHTWKPEDDKTIAREYAKSDPKGWFQWWIFQHGGGKVIAYADNRVGVQQIEATGSLGANDDTLYNEFGKGENSRFAMGHRQTNREYEFPQPVSTELLRHPETLYQHERVRVSGTSVRVFERFAAGSSKLVARVWRLMGSRNTPRQEIFNAEGRLVRAVAVDYLNEDPTRPLWIENLAQYKHQIKVPFENIYLRIYDYDVNGKESLVAIGWTDYPREKFFENQSGSRRALLNAYNDAIARAMEKPLEKREAIPAKLTYYFGTPDGTVKWKNYDEFNKAFGPFQEPDAPDVIFPNGRYSGNR